MAYVSRCISLQSTGEAQEVLSLRQGPVRLVRMLKTPLEGINYMRCIAVLGYSVGIQLG